MDPPTASTEEMLATLLAEDDGKPPPLLPLKELERGAQLSLFNSTKHASTLVGRSTDRESARRRISDGDR